MITFPFLSENLSEVTGGVNVPLSRQEQSGGPLPLWDFHAILVDPDSTPNQARQAKLGMLEVLEASEAFRPRPMLVPVLNVPEPEETTSAGSVRPSLVT